jgi:hypothetical protein
LEDQGVYRRIKLEWIFRKWWRGMDWIDPNQDRGRWRAIVKVVMNLRFSWNARNFLTSWEPVSFSGTLLHGASKYLDID